MKNFLCRVLLMTTTLLLIVCGCQSTPHYMEDTQDLDTYQETYGINEYVNPIQNTNFPEEALYEFFHVYQSDGSTVLSKFNVTTGDVSPLCSDPLCSHDDYNCAFYNAGDTILRSEDGSRFYYWQMGEQEFRIMSYHIGDNRLEILYTEPIEDMESQRQSLLNFGYYWCRYEAIDVFYRVDLLSGEKEELDATYHIPSAYVDGRFYCTNQGSPSTIVYSLDGNMQDQQIIAKDCVWYYVNFDHVENTEQGYITYSEWIEGELLPYQYEISTGEKTADFPNSPYSASDPVYKNKHFYLTRVENPRFMGTDKVQNRDVYNRFGGKVYAYNTTTAESILIFDNNDYVFTYGSMVDQYLVYDYGEFVLHALFGVPSWQERAGGKIVINTETNEYCIYPNTWDENYNRLS